MTRSRRFTAGVGTVAAAALLAGAAPRGHAHETEYRGTVAAVDAARVQVRLLDEEGEPTGKLQWFTVAEKTRVSRGARAVSFAEARVAVDERIVVIVAHGDEAGSEWTCPMHPQVALPEPGLCPLCGMSLRERARAATATTIRLADRP